MIVSAAVQCRRCGWIWALGLVAESNSPPAEFGRFNGGVVNLTTKSGGNALHGSAFEFLRHEALNARNSFASTTPVKPRFRRNQFGGVMGGPIRRDRTSFFVDYQGQRQGVFTEAIAGRVPAIYDPSTTTPGAHGGVTRSPLPGNTIPGERIDAAARALLQRYPLTQVADSLTWLTGRHTVKLGADLRWERLNVVQPPSPTGVFTFSNLFSDLPGVANTGTPLASFLLGQVQQFSIDDAPGVAAREDSPGNAGGDLQRANRPPFGAPNTTVGSAAFGTITSAGDPRVVQVALKFVF